MKKNFILITTLILMISCCIDANKDIDNEDNNTETFTQTITNTLGKTLYLVKMNPTVKNISAEKSGYVNLESNVFIDSNENYTLQNSTEFIRRDNPLALTFYPKNASASARVRAFNSVEYDIGDEKPFWIMTNDASYISDIVWGEIYATLRAKGDFCYIWVPDKYWENGNNSISEIRVKELAKKFNSIYPRVTNVFGYPYSSKSPIHILILDINPNRTSSTTTVTFGYFMPKDYSEYDETYRSNECCMFYLDAALTEEKPEAAYSTLAHEFQHMINYYNKIFCTSANNEESYTWFTEMLSMLCEDMMQTFLGISDNESPIARLQEFNCKYFNQGITEWQGNTLSYACVYAFGAYLVRNFGGVKLLSAIGKNELINRESITAALKELGYDETFNSVFLKFSEALIYEDSNKLTFNKSITEELNGYEYTFKAFNIWETRNYSYYYDPYYYYGPYYFSPAKSLSVRPYGFTIHTQESWKNIRTDTLTVKITKPKNSNIEYRFILK